MSTGPTMDSRFRGNDEFQEEDLTTGRWGVRIPARQSPKRAKCGAGVVASILRSQ
ncbi:hypothetical protein BH11GEM2_BH11GEM2_32300 [soil metagenome]